MQDQMDIVYSVAFSPDGKRVATGHSNGTAKIWDVATEMLIWTLEGHTNAVTSIAFSLKGERLLTGSLDGTAKLWDFELGRETLTLQSHRNGITSVAFSPDGKRIVTAAWDAEAMVWDAESAQRIAILDRYESWVETAVFSPPDNPSSAPIPNIGKMKQAPTRMAAMEEISGNTSSSLSCCSTDALAFTKPQLRDRRSNMLAPLYFHCACFGNGAILHEIPA